ncbi:hypothetical protein QR680_017356 [Steinernema hermaphroditum]|uniref:MYND-type domain-containing protein n=1 Tax=Steinernema hermaphroditum TaxID=289476 RepID=A0AA39HF98_9BILA|nr:hypothetical protein QR680_017356 [Steinernema hermaphroditum]
MSERTEDDEAEALRVVSTSTQTTPEHSFESLLCATFSAILAAVITWTWLLRPYDDPPPSDAESVVFRSLKSIPSSASELYVTPPMSRASSSPERTPRASPEPLSEAAPLSPTSISTLTALLETDSLPTTHDDDDEGVTAFGMFERYRVPPYRREANRSFYPAVLEDVSIEEFEAFEIPGGVALQHFLAELPPTGAYGFLDAITEEESDDLWSQSSASSHRFVASSVASTTLLKSPPLAEPEELDNELEKTPEPSEEASKKYSSNPVLSEADESEPDDSPTTPEDPSIHATIPPEKMTDADRDQSEVVVSVADRIAAATSQFQSREEEVLSVQSMSITLDRSRDSLLDQSICSNPRDESSIMARSLLASKASRGDESLDDDFPPPPETTPTAASASVPTPHTTVITTVTTIEQTADGDKKDTASRSVCTFEAPSTSKLAPGPGVLACELRKTTPKGGAESKSPPPNEPTSHEIPVTVAGSGWFAKKEGDVDLERSMRRYAKYGRIYADAPRSQMAPAESSDLPAMDIPPSEPPPPPPVQRVFEGDGACEDSSEGHRSRNTVREIPVHRATSAFGVPATTMTMEYRTSSTQPWSNGSTQPHAEEYYRREVMTRTLVTRSTEALSVPPLGRSSPVESTITSLRYPLEPRYAPSEYREEKTVDYNFKYTRNVEEEERRVKENQERRRREEEERRRREEENRRKWELEERERLERLHREFELQEHELEKERLEKERSELSRLERDRQERKLTEERRRKEWERNEQDRRVLEEQELEKQRELERRNRDRLARERAERERLERERLERERLQREQEEQRRLEEERRERERIEMERLEIERIERIKRERVERERIQREKEREEEERLEKERLELERLERERLELERQQRELLEIQRREEEQRERERREELMREQLRREEETREREMLREFERLALERENQRRFLERQEQERLDAIRREQERRGLERQEMERKERERKEDERREQELLAAQRRAQERREQERIADEQREREWREEERRAQERREQERREAEEREERRRIEEEQEHQRLADLAEKAARRRLEREEELLHEKRLEQLLREAEEHKELNRLEMERRQRERDEEQRRLLELKEKQRRLAEERERERRDAERREEERRRNAHRSRDRLDLIHKELEDKERLEREKRRKNLELERRHKLTSRETLEGLTRPPYFSRENLAPEVTTKVERQVIERVDRTLWTQDGLDTSVEEGGQRERLYNPREEDFQRGSSRRTSRYKAKMEKARREFLAEPSSAADAVGDRFRKSAEDLQRRKPEYRGPLLQKFQSGELSSKSGDLNVFPALGYSRVGPSPYEEEYNRLKAEAERNLAPYRFRSSQPNLYAGGRTRTTSVGYLETDVDSGLQRTVDEAEELRRSKSALDYESTTTRHSRKEQMEHGDSEAAHMRSKSADFLMDRRTREENAPPENELQKTADASHRDLGLSEHELRFRKSVEKLQTPDWYREHVERFQLDSTFNSTADPLPPAPRSLSQAWSQHDGAVGGIALPSGMFDRYRGEIEDLRRSRTSLHQTAPTPTQHTKSSDDDSAQAHTKTAITESVSQEVVSRTDVNTVVKRLGRQLPGYTVTTVPSDWNDLPLGSRVIEVADTFVGSRHSFEGNVGDRYCGRVTLEEVLDAIFQQTESSHVPNDASAPQFKAQPLENVDGPGIYTTNYMLMNRVLREPHLAESLLREEQLFVRCSHCHRTRELSAAREHFLSCKHCYTYYCSRKCRFWDWDRHKELCSFARINTLCKDVIMKVRSDSEAQWHMSKVAREGYAAFGRGSVNIRLRSAHAAQSYLTLGWRTFRDVELSGLLFYYPVQTLAEQRKESSLIALVRKYNPDDKFILSVSIIADIDQCPQTPPPERRAPPHYDEPPLPLTSAKTSGPSGAHDLYQAAVPTDV